MIIGIDEVGRGPLAGPAVVGAVAILSNNAVTKLCSEASIKQLKDSKKLSPVQRGRLYEAVKLRDDIVWSVGEAGPDIVDEVGIVAGLRHAAGLAIDGILARNLPVEGIIADAGLRHPFEDKYSTEWHVKGDEKFEEIMLASIMAKVWRDRIMMEAALVWPAYGFERNVGYGTAGHRAAIQAEGLCPLHRRSFCRSFLT